MCPCVRLTSHEEEQSSHVLHETSVPATAKHADDPAEQDDGHSHAHEPSRHSPQVWGKAEKLAQMVQDCGPNADQTDIVLIDIKEMMC